MPPSARLRRDCGARREEQACRRRREGSSDCGSNRVRGIRLLRVFPWLFPLVVTSGSTPLIVLRGAGLFQQLSEGLQARGGQLPKLTLVDLATRLVKSFHDIEPLVCDARHTTQRLYLLEFAREWTAQFVR